MDGGIELSEKRQEQLEVTKEFAKSNWKFIVMGVLVLLVIILSVVIYYQNQLLAEKLLDLSRLFRQAEHNTVGLPPIVQAIVAKEMRADPVRTENMVDVVGLPKNTQVIIDKMARQDPPVSNFKNFMSSDKVASMECMTPNLVGLPPIVQAIATRESRADPQTLKEYMNNKTELPALVSALYK